ncbi:hypothetical protein ECG_09121 [Echinococcus granulosus]|uniref:Uncharacterized protein n=1 Tax=Echinococcus granulosus TaxID=6210 RepID=W6U4X5_ECHGR|nr:hypothetical protein EGR_08915 [Echinococcus granulosus]EUB56213.1 hypothetical protein EGR_08915 [Echinococcus granulosus]KAH9278120.1 hypothetical protein ECG_09121 [Echinococcus granulosus]
MMNCGENLRPYSFVAYSRDGYPPPYTVMINSVKPEMVEREVTAFDECNLRVVPVHQMDMVTDYLMQAQAAHHAAEEITNHALDLAQSEV